MKCCFMFGHASTPFRVQPALEEAVPRRYAIVKANQYMADRADSILCYALNFGNSRKLLDYARRRSKVPIENLAQPL